MILDTIAWSLTVFLLLVTVIPISRLPHGAVRTLSFARQQIIVLAALTLPIVFWRAEGNAMWLAGLALLAVIGFQLAYISRFFPFMPTQSVRADPAIAADRKRCLRIMTSNVKLSNRDYERLLAVAVAEDPDILVVVETDQQWFDALAPLHEAFPHRALKPHDNGYGMGIYSKVAFDEVEWRELLINDVPSARITLTVGGDRLRLYVIHPEPPVPTFSTEGRDAEIGLVGIEVDEDPLPCIVLGDLNDVAWSHTTRRFQRLSGLQDPRVGRGFYNTFDARFPFMRWPLDHLFHDARFRLVDMRRLPAIGSDHFPMLFDLYLAPTEGNGEAEVEEPTEEDREEVEEMAEHERKQDRDAIGSHWEDED
ncbi:endonuclease/exonuclease/phosphatase family protein [Wenxinia saemankumensis]|uniref:Uncharacterized conserved protein YafD, endonuclease/exonuclease/phosphatase (EEP) superfamily n=1 Tax=Wenxinia saemankumensis TaxID=1447782 RepID=A0A1M6CC43_9RHOB|nr:endonuclease/exonuclease/phosphatase family protein [Wenxinia saemankumensis]SHI58298.1 Uncharacterized conserved protein YafD, endonuclease/exonuclease/phosphatase (EEP) superfamily [Wenxinia saemankumensis]